MIRKTLATVLSLVFVCTAYSAPALAGDEAIETIRKNLSQMRPHMAITSISKGPVDGIYEVVSGPTLMYITADGKNLIDGSIIDLRSGTNYTEQAQGKRFHAALADLGEDKMLIYRPEKSVDIHRNITVYTDVTCGFCRKLHQELPSLLAAGVSVRYLMYPRAGVNSGSYRSLESIWCADNPQDAMSIAKNTLPGSVTPKNCPNPIREHMALANGMGLRGTPMLLLDSGRVVSGYRPAPQLIQMLKESQPLQTASANK